MLARQNRYQFSSERIDQIESLLADGSLSPGDAVELEFTLGEMAQQKEEFEEAKKQNLTDLEEVQREMGFDLLMNESRFIEKDGQRIALVGVENIVVVENGDTLLVLNMEKDQLVKEASKKLS